MRPSDLVEGRKGFISLKGQKDIRSKENKMFKGCLWDLWWTMCNLLWLYYMHFLVLADNCHEGGAVPLLLHNHFILRLEYIYVCVCAQSVSCVRLIETPSTLARQAPLSMGFSRQEPWSILVYSRGSSWPRGRTHVSSGLAGIFFTTSATWECRCYRLNLFLNVWLKKWASGRRCSQGSLGTS